MTKRQAVDLIIKRAMPVLKLMCEREKRPRLACRRCQFEFDAEKGVCGNCDETEGR